MTASLLKSPGLFSVFWPISTMLNGVDSFTDFHFLKLLLLLLLLFTPLEFFTSVLADGLSLEFA